MMTDDILSSCSLAARGLNQRMLNAAKRLAGVKSGWNITRIWSLAFRTGSRLVHQQTHGRRLNRHGGSEE